MVTLDKIALRAALAIYGQLAEARQGQNPIELPVCYWQDMERLTRRIRQASARSWHAAHRKLLDQLLGQAERLQWYLNHLLAEGRKRSTDRQLPLASDVYGEILALGQEFSDITIDLRNHELSVTTEPIVLEGIHLGRFQIRLDYSEPDLCYRVVALEPNPAAGREDVTHPHVQDESLCEGEGRAAIQAALAHGRLSEFFLVVAQILATYGRGRAYIELDHWDGVTCDDCGASISSEDRSTCERCDKILCEDCSASCPHCGRTCCSSCMRACSGCQEPYCRICLENCTGCGKPTCPCCRTKGLCENCHERESEEARTSADADKHEPPGEDPGSEPAATSVLGVGGCD